jgi:hypothetical protein
MATSAGPIAVQAKALSLTSNEVSIPVVMITSELALTTNPQTLEWQTPTEVTFNLTYKGAPLPAGLEVAITSPDQSVANLPTQLTQTGGLVIGSAVKAVKSTSPLTVEAAVAGFSARPQASLDVYFVSSNFAAQLDVTRTGGGDESAYSGVYPNGFLLPCLTNQIKMTLAYKGQLLTNWPVTVTGFQLSVSGQSTNSAGELSGTVVYNKTHKDAYLANPNYLFNATGASFSWPSPLPLSFTTCP